MDSMDCFLGFENGWIHRGKVRDIYDLGGDLLLIVATDRISAFDVVLPNGIPGKGCVLNNLSDFWFSRTKKIVKNHLITSIDDISIVSKAFSKDLPHCFDGRSMVVMKAERIDIECIIRGYLSGSSWTEYQKYGTVGGVSMPKGLKESDQLPEVCFTPTMKSEEGHDEPITIGQMKNMIGRELTSEIIAKTFEIYNFAQDYAKKRGIIIADTKMEFGFVNGELNLIDELLTPDSSRFWDLNKYNPGGPQESFDKQPVRDWLEASGWDKKPPAPKLPSKIVEETSRRYKKIYEILTS